MERFEQERIKAMEEANQIYNCSGNQVHNPRCDGNCGIRILNDLEVKINQELRRWAEVGMVPFGSLPQAPTLAPGVPVNTLKLEVSLAALIEVLYEWVDEEALNEKFQEMYLERLTAIREENQDQIRKAKAREQITPPDISQLIVPDYIMKKH